MRFNLYLQWVVKEWQPDEKCNYSTTSLNSNFSKDWNDRLYISDVLEYLEVTTRNDSLEIQRHSLEKETVYIVNW